MNGSTCRLATVRSGARATICVSSVAVLSPGVWSPPPLNVATLTTSVAFAATFTRIAISGNESPGASASLRVHVTVCEAIVHAQPGPDAGRRRQASRKIVGRP